MTNSQHSQFVHRRVLKINVGFLLAQGAGYQRMVEIDIPRVRLDDEVELGFLRGNLQLSRNAQGIWVQGILKTPVRSVCSRCLSAVDVTVDLEIEELFSFEPTSDALYAVDEAGVLDLSPLLREEAILVVPMGVLCDPLCEGLCPECGQNLNEGVCNCEPDDIDPRFAILRDRLDQIEHSDVQ